MPPFSCPPARPLRSRLRGRLAGLASLALTLAGCASFTPDGGMAPVAAQVADATGAETIKIMSQDGAAAADARAKSLLAKTLTADGAVQVALFMNRGLQAEYNALGLSEATYVAASLPPNPSFSIERIASGGELDVERRLIANLLSLATLPLRSEVARTEFEAARQKAVEATFRAAAETRRAYYRAVAARQTIAFLEQARASADAAADLTRKLGETGAATKLDQARASAFYAEVANELAQARMKAGAEHEALTRRLGLWGGDINYRLPAQLPAMPAIKTVQQVEVDAVRKRVDLIAARLELDAMAKSHGLTGATRFVSALNGGWRGDYVRTTNDGVSDSTAPQGFVLEVEIPIFDLGEANVRRAQELYMQAVNRLLEKAVNVRSEAREAYAIYRASHDIARLYQSRILPLRKTINQEAQLQYNGMLIDVFELLTTAREGVNSNVAAIAAKRDVFIASVDFETAIIGGGSSGGEQRVAASAN